MQNEPIEVTLKVTGALEKLGVPYLSGVLLAPIYLRCPDEAPDAIPQGDASRSRNERKDVRI